MVFPKKIFIIKIIFMTQYEKFLKLHYEEHPLLIGNVWDVISAKAFEQRGFKAIATSSAALARTLGYEDGEKIPFELLLKMAERIISNINIPLSVDMEGGYSRNIAEIIQNIEKLHALGVVGINIEDSVKAEEPYMHAVDDFKEILSSVNAHLEKKNMKMYINARTDAYVLKLPSPLDETLKRIKVYEAAGASGIFVPFLSEKEEIKKVVESTRLPVNVFATPQLPSFNELAQAGVRRISMATLVHRATISSIEKVIQTILDEQSFRSLYETYNLLR
jgi:2-methylisocitrate lyase-like PEP mutase family enzyme